MRKTGILRIDVNTGISTLDSGPNDQNRLAKQGPGDQLGNATDFLVGERGLGDMDFIWVDGNPPSGGVIVITDAGRVGDAVGSNSLVASAKSGKKKPASKKAGAKKAAKKVTTKSSKKSNSAKRKPK